MGIPDSECYFFIFFIFFISHHTPYTTSTETGALINVFAHIGLNAPVLVRSPKLSRAKSGQYLGGRPPGNTGW